jgi:hypothetical protein
MRWNSESQTQSNCRAARWRSVFWTQRLRDRNNFKAPSPLAAVFGDWPPPENHSSPHREIISTAPWERTPTTFRFPQRQKETEQTFKMKFDLGYVKPEEVPQIPRLSKTPAAIAYAPLGDASFTPDAILFACKASGAMLLNEAGSRAGIGSGAPALGRPTCMALPATLQAGSVVSLGCIGNRVYTDLGEDELYFVVRGKDLAALADALEAITGANGALQQYAQSRRAELATV